MIVLFCLAGEGLNLTKSSPCYDFNFTKVSSLILTLNFVMLGIGYYGVVNPEHKLFAMIGGFLPFFAMFFFCNLCHEFL